MKPENRTTSTTTKDPKDLKDATARAAVPSVAATELEADLLAIAAEEAALNLRKLQRRQQYWDQTIASLSLTLQQLLSHDFERAAIGKALGFALPKASTASKNSPRPSTLDDWLSIYRATGMRAYLKTHPDFASTLKTNKVKPSAYLTHLPPDDLKALDQAARQKAHLKLPSSTPSEVVA
jgi:hypothetical protein